MATMSEHLVVMVRELLNIMSQQELAKRTDLDQSTISRILNTGGAKIKTYEAIQNEYKRTITRKR